MTSRQLTRNYLVEFVDGDHAWSEGAGGFDACRNAETRWGVPVRRYKIDDGLWQRVEAPVQ